MIPQGNFLSRIFPPWKLCKNERGDCFWQVRREKGHFSKWTLLRHNQTGKGRCWFLLLCSSLLLFTNIVVKLKLSVRLYAFVSVCVKLVLVCFFWRNNNKIINCVNIMNKALNMMFKTNNKNRSTQKDLPGSKSVHHVWYIGSFSVTWKVYESISLFDLGFFRT
jgi:hypothetical protein